MEQQANFSRRDSQRNTESIYGRLTFHPRAGNNVVVSDCKRTAERKNSIVQTGFGGVVTVRQVLDGEKFIVQVKKILDFWGGYSIGIGMTNLPANLMDYPPWMALSKPNNWMMYFYEGWPGCFCLYQNGKELSRQFGITATQIKVGDQLCVEKRDGGDLLFYLNGFLMGKALLNITERVYGIADIHGNVEQISIVDSI